ncbi:MAG: DUF4142 domain-containing protein [Anaeromyxobacter sp.]
MKSLERWGIAAAVAALALAGPAWGQSGGTGGGTGAGSSGTGTGTGSSGAASGRQTGTHGAEASPGDKATDMSSGASSTGSSNTGSTSDTGGATTGSSATGKVDKKLSDGLAKLHAANQAEVQMGQMGVSMAQDEQVKAFAQQMVDDHGQNDQQLQQLAQTAGASLTGKGFDDKQQESQKAMQKVHGKSGAEFDKAFMSHMVKDHEKDTKEVGKLAKAAQKSNPELATFLQTTETTMQGHLDKARQIEKSLKHGGAQATGASHAGTGSSSGGQDQEGYGK